MAENGRLWDLLVVGGGTAGLVGAQTAAGFGASVLLVESARTGGECLWTGCVPSKALLAAAHAAADARSAARFGVAVQGVTVDFPAVMAHVQRAVDTIAPVDSPEALEAAGVQVRHGRLRFVGPDTAVVDDGEPLRFRAALLATGSDPVVPELDGLAAAGPLTNETVWSLATLPERLLVLGGGSIGCELGQAFARLGSGVTLVETADRLLPAEDEQASAVLRQRLEADGVEVRTSTAVTRVRPAGSGSTVELDDGTTVTVDRVLVATGRRPRTAELGLESAGVRTDSDGAVRVDDRLRTTNPRIWAAGDVTAHPRFTHVAGVHATTAVTNALLGLRRRAVADVVPRVTYTQPEVASVGVRTDQVDSGTTIRTVPHTRIDRPITEQDTAGFSRLAIDRRGRIVGATVVSPRAGESLAELVLATSRGLRARDVVGSMHAYPTYSDGAWNAAIAHVRAQLGSPVSRRALGLLIRLRRRRAG